MTFDPSWMRRSAIAAPMPDVAPMTRVFLYWKGIVRSMSYSLGDSREARDSRAEGLVMPDEL